ncbi:unnamed protein product, partial [marine sediment metagenome]
LDNYINIEAYERDMILDDLARDAGLFPLINQLQKMDVVIIGPRPLRRLHFLNRKHFVQISSPNLHLEFKQDRKRLSGIDWAVEDALEYGKPAVYLVSAGVSAAVIIDRLHDEIPDSFFIDCGSIWDAFVGIGEQREWRANLYDNPIALAEWEGRNLYGSND